MLDIITYFMQPFNFFLYLPMTFSNGDTKKGCQATIKEFIYTLCIVDFN